MKSPRPTILNSEITRIPQPGAAALGCRAIQRSLCICRALQPPSWTPEADHFAVNTMQWLQTAAEELQADPETETKLRRQSKVLNSKMPCMSIARLAYLVSDYALGLTGMSASRAMSTCASISWNIKDKNRQKYIDRLIRNLSYDEFRTIRIAFELGSLKSTTPVKPESLGPIWPDGEPDWKSFRWETEKESASGLGYQFQFKQKNQISCSNRMPLEIQEALDATVTDSPRGLALSHAYAPPDRKGWPVALQRAETLTVRQLAAFYSEHAGAELFVPAALNGTPLARRFATDCGSVIADAIGSMSLIPPKIMSIHRRVMLDIDIIYDQFDPEYIDEENRRYVSRGEDPGESLPPFRKRDMLVFATQSFTPDMYFVVTAGPVAGNIYFSDHETGIDFSEPFATSLVDWLLRVANDGCRWAKEVLKDVRSRDKSE